MCPIFKRQAVKDCSTIEAGSDMLSLNISNYQSTLRNTTEERRFHLPCGGSLESCKNTCGTEGQLKGVCGKHSDFRHVVE